MIGVWRSESGKALYSLMGHEHWVTGIARNSHRLFSVSCAKDELLLPLMKVWDFNGHPKLLDPDAPVAGKHSLNLNCDC
jgi:hypothetical protein